MDISLHFHVCPNQICFFSCLSGTVSSSEEISILLLTSKLLSLTIDCSVF